MNNEIAEMREYIGLIFTYAEKLNPEYFIFLLRDFLEGIERSNLIREMVLRNRPAVELCDWAKAKASFSKELKKITTEGIEISEEVKPRRIIFDGLLANDRRKNNTHDKADDMKKYLLQVLYFARQLNPSYCKSLELDILEIEEKRTPLYVDSTKLGEWDLAKLRAKKITERLHEIERTEKKSYFK